MYKSSSRSDKPYIPQGYSEIWDFIGGMMLTAPKFEDDSGFFPDQDIETEFFALNEGLKTIRKQVGEENYRSLVALSERMQGYFEADPEDTTGDCSKGRDCILQMEEILRASRRRKAR